VAMATSRCPPRGVRPTSWASAGNRKAVGARAYGGLGTITFGSCYISGMAQPAKSVLWVDDEAELLEPHRMFLRDKGFEVEAVTNADDAVEMVRRRSFNLVLLDEQMPGKRGMDALRELREADPNLAIVMVTKSEEDATMTEALGAALDGYLVKPVTPRQVYAAVTRLLEGAKIHQQAVARKFVERFRDLQTEPTRGLGWRAGLGKSQHAGIGGVGCRAPVREHQAREKTAKKNSRRKSIHRAQTLCCEDPCGRV